MNPISDQQLVAEAKCQVVHDKWLSEVSLRSGVCCMACRNRLGDEIHEICSGPTRMECRGKPAGLLFLCRECHAWVQGLPWQQEIDGHTYMVKIGVNLAIKFRSDARHFDPEVVRDILRGENKTAEKFDWEDISHGLEVLERTESR